MSTVSNPQSSLLAARASTTAIFLANGVGIGAWSIAIPHLAKSLSLGNRQLSWIVFAFAVGAIIAMPLTGYVGTKVRTRTSAIGAGLIFGAFLALSPWVSSFPVSLFLALVIGASNGAMDVSMNAHAVEVEQNWGRPIMSSFHAAFSVGGALGAALASQVPNPSSAAGGLWEPSTLVLLLVSGAAVFMVPGASAAPSWTFRAPSGVFIGVCLLALSCMMMEGAIVDWSAILLLQAGVKPQRISVAYIAFSCFMILGRVMGSKITSLFSNGQILRFGGLFAAFGFALVFSFPSLGLFAIGFGLIGLGLANIVPILFSIAGRLEAPTVGVAMAATASYAGFLVGPVVIGALAAATSVRCALTILIAPALFIAGATFTPRLRQSL